MVYLHVNNLETLITHTNLLFQLSKQAQKYHKNFRYDSIDLKESHSPLPRFVFDFPIIKDATPMTNYGKTTCEENNPLRKANILNR